MGILAWGLLALCVFLVIEGGKRALALSFKWIDVIAGLLLIAAGVLCGIAVLQGKF
jgi:hypothetical protein